MILLFGLDRCGKTTVGRAFHAARPHYYYYHHTRPPMAAFEYFGRFLTTARPHGIVDRGHWCEWAYGLAYRGKQDLNVSQFWMLDLFAFSQGGIAVYLYDELDKIAARWDEKEMYDMKGAGVVMDTYVKIMNEVTCLPYYTAKMTDLISEDGKLTEVAQAVLSLADDQAQIAQGALPPSLGFGVPGGFLLLGDAPNQDVVPSGGVYAPFVYGKTSEWIWRALFDHKIDWRRGYYTNTTSFGNADDFSRYVARQVYPEITVCLGANAAKMARAAGVPHVQIEHPAFARRFKGGDFEAWALQLASALGCFPDRRA
jgi:hypothetical protein